MINKNIVFNKIFNIYVFTLYLVSRITFEIYSNFKDIYFLKIL